VCLIALLPVVCAAPSAHAQESEVYARAGENDGVHYTEEKASSGSVSESYEFKNSTGESRAESLAAHGAANALAGTYGLTPAPEGHGAYAASGFSDRITITVPNRPFASAKMTITWRVDGKAMSAGPEPINENFHPTGQAYASYHISYYGMFSSAFGEGIINVTPDGQRQIDVYVGGQRVANSQFFETQSVTLNLGTLDASGSTSFPLLRQQRARSAAPIACQTSDFRGRGLL